MLDKYNSVYINGQNHYLKIYNADFSDFNMKRKVINNNKNIEILR